MENIRRGPGARLLLILPAGALMLLGLYAGLLLVGLPLPSLAARLAELHAPLLVFGFVGSLISLERAVALGTGWCSPRRPCSSSAPWPPWRRSRSALGS